MSDAEEVAILIHRADKLGFNMVDLYLDGDEVIAFTCSKSKDYIEAIQNIEIHPSTPSANEVEK